MPNYSDNLTKRNKLINEANNIMRIYQNIADDLFRKEAGKYAGVTRIDVEEDGIHYEYYFDTWDYSKGRGDFFVSKEKLEKLELKYTRKEKLKNISYESNR